MSDCVCFSPACSEARSPSSALFSSLSVATCARISASSLRSFSGNPVSVVSPIRVDKRPPKATPAVIAAVQRHPNLRTPLERAAGTPADGADDASR